MVKRILSIALIALVGTVLVNPNNAQAQVQDVDQAAFGQLIAALNNINAQVRALENVDVDVEDVRIVNISDIQETLNDNQVEVLNNTLAGANIKVLHDFLNDSLNENHVLNQALNQNNIQVSDVVAVNVLSGGDVIIYTRDPAE